MKAKKDALQIFRSAVAAVQPAYLIPQAISILDDNLEICGTKLPLKSLQKVTVIGAGKASASMARETEKILGKLITNGIICTKYGHSLPLNKINIIEAGHPLPDENSVRAAEGTFRLLKEISFNDIVICLISGGASSLWADLPSEVSLDEIRKMNDLLVRSGATIDEINSVRKHVSVIKGGQLIRQCNGAQVFTLIISDVPGDDISIIGSGPSIADNSSFQDAYNVIITHNLDDKMPAAIMDHINKGLKGMINENPKTGDPVFNRSKSKIIGTNRMALEAAAIAACKIGYETTVEESTITGDTVTEARRLVSNALSYTGKEKACLIQGGETTLTVTGSGKGGRNQHFVLAALHEFIANEKKIPEGITILSCGTDGTDGPTDAAGAMIDTQMLMEAPEINSTASDYLNRFDSYHFFRNTGGLIITGPTQTNVMDIMITLINPMGE